MTNTNRETTLKRVPYIWYLIQFRQENDKNKDKEVKTLMNLDNKVNEMHPTYATKLGFCTKKIGVSA